MQGFCRRVRVLLREEESWSCRKRGGRREKREESSKFLQRKVYIVVWSCRDLWGNGYGVREKHFLLVVWRARTLKEYLQVRLW